MEDRDWTGTAAALAALAMTAGVWLWAPDEAPPARSGGEEQMAGDLQQWRDEARRWSDLNGQDPAAVQVSSAGLETWLVRLGEEAGQTAVR
ncbi:MAG: hypothetical protein NVV74_00985 [Magnetospirillum sp.]|nr:hypothetical protein [Magnetospirillum sp.]